MVGIETKFKKVYASGKRKSAVAKALLKSGNGKITFNGIDIKNLEMFNQLKLAEPFEIAKQILDKVEFDCELSVKGGGEKSQIDAARLAFAKAIIDFTKSEKLKEAFLNYDRTLLIADVRRKEPCKPGDSKARAKRQSSKR
jgi:small subunit ribosomal protein S9